MIDLSRIGTTMDDSGFSYIGRGVYTLSEAARLSAVPARRIRRWTSGYRYKHRGEFRYSPPPVASVAPEYDGAPVVSFGDLIEVRFLNAFREYGVSWNVIRTASAAARELIGRPHPFSSRIFRTDGRTILAELTRVTGDKLLLNLVNHQYELERIVSPFLYAGLEYNHEEQPARWWPLGESRHVLIDPQRALGAPIDPDEGVPTRVIYNAFLAEESVGFVARWFEIKPEAVRDAVEFEESLIA
jgi:uncharacterized protein (DUF433 family)